MDSSLQFVRRCSVYLTLAVLAAVWTPAYAQPNSVDSTAVSGKETQADGGDDDMIVTGTRTPQRRSDSPISTEVITRKEIEESGATNLGQLMANAPGVQVQRTFAGVGIALQGLDAKHTLVLLDGDRIPGSKDGVFDIERLNLENIERVEILRGAGSALYGADALGGVVNIITRKESREDHVSTHLQTFFGDDKSSETVGRLSTRTGRVSGTVSGGYHWLPAFRVASNDEAIDEATDGSSIEDWYLRGVSRVNVLERSRLNVGIEYAKRQRAGVDASGNGAVFDRRQVVDMYDAFMSFEHKADGGDRFVSSLRYNYLRDQFLMDQRLSDRGDKYEDSRLQYTQGNGQTDLKLPAQNVLSLGVDGIFETAENPRIVRYNECDFESPSISCRTADRYRGAVYLQNVWTILNDPYLVLVAGSRFEGDSRFGHVAVPRVALRYDPIESLTLRTSIGQGYRAPTFKELYLRFDNPSVGYTVRGNDALEPELSMSYQLSADLKIKSFASVYLNLFRNEIEGLIDYDLVAPGSADGSLDLYQLVNQTDVTTQGGQAELLLRYGYLAILRFGYQYLDAYDEIQRRALAGRPTHQFSGALTLRYPPAGLSWHTQAVWTGERPFYVPDDAMNMTDVIAASYLNLATSVVWKFHTVLSVTARAENLTDAGEAVYLNQRPRRFVLGLSANI
ncbi:MAG: hypothetical protein CMH52_12485 [Myxococcales bacterium]|nr:hypothetical protein [Myxococcales bacterium]